ncbi:hypothetical protein ACG0Z6_05660 [Roseateles sp. BYS180W]|uniref:Uncharacterized protein n=1 Tax=Roseateles rivi TaxID=3299028 RepID=A0ABW7FTS4_9BURK
MKALIWGLCAVLVLLWSGSCWVLGALLAWGASALAQGDIAQMGQAAASWPMPEWMGFWIDADMVKSLQQWLQWVLDTSKDSLPWLGSALSWLSPLVWLLWGLGLLALLALAAVAHFLVGRAMRLPTRMG